LKKHQTSLVTSIEKNQSEFVWIFGKQNKQVFKDFLLIHAKGSRYGYICSDFGNQRFIIKISPLELPSTLNQPPPLNCLEEANLLISIQNENLINQIPKIVGAGTIRDTWSFLIEPFYVDEGICSAGDIKFVLLQVLDIIFTLGSKEVLHRDIRIENIRVHGGCVRLIDFNRAISIPDLHQDISKNSDIIGVGENIIPSHENPMVQPQSFSRLVEYINQKFKSQFQVSNLMSDYKINNRRYKSMDAKQLLSLIRQSRATGDKRIWDTDKHIPYYTFKFMGESIKGERKLEDRLEILNYPHMEGKKYLDLGCNLGLFSTNAVEHLGASLAAGIDHDPKIIECARIIAKERSCDGKTIFIASSLMDISAEWLLLKTGFSTFEYVSCFSVFRHIQKNGQGALYSFLETVSEICSSNFYFENCSNKPTSQIIKFLKRRGFRQIVFLGKSERNRDICVAYKGEANIVRAFLTKLKKQKK
jgi:2-polyprenyl-3-methyl-5-hydroxy-6-metoxy-1,4-benzoquinol methylase